MLYNILPLNDLWRTYTYEPNKWDDISIGFSTSSHYTRKFISATPMC